MNSSVQSVQAAGSSRKRSFAEITKSESPSASPPPPSKRRRTSINPALPSTVSSSSQAASRFVGDGLDFRTPVMSRQEPFGNQVSNTIDLTLDDDSPSPTPSRTVQQPTLHTFQSRPSAGQLPRAPPFPTASSGYEVIDLSTLDDDDVLPSSANVPLPIPTSPELEFVGARERTPPQPPPQRHTSRRLPPPSTLSSLGDLAQILRGATQTMFGNLRYDRDHNDLARLGGPPPTTQRVTYDPTANLAIYEDVDLDYGLAGFTLGLPEEPPQNPPDRTYKAPAAARDGYTRTYDEDDVLVCGFCGDELAAGNDEVKAQVWIVKACGHAYCGACAQSRPLGRSSNKDKKKANAKKLFAFRACTVPGCDKTVDSKTKMFQIYL